MANGEFVGFLDHDDELEPEALYENIKILNERKDADLIYSDDDKINENGLRYDPQFKPDWSPELLLSYCYISHFKIIRKSIFLELGGYNKDFDGSQDYDFLLRLAEKTDKIFHIPKVLYHWRSLPGSVAKSTSEKPLSMSRGMSAVKQALSRRNVQATVSQPNFAKNGNLGIFKLKFNPLSISEKITIIIPTKDKVELLDKCISSIRNKTSYKNYEIIVINNNSKERKTYAYLNKANVRCLNIKTSEFNFSKINNLAVQESKSDIIVFMNNDIEVISSSWLADMAGTLLLDKKIGAVGSRLVYPDKRIQHGGIVLGLNNSSAGHANKLLHFNLPGYLGYNLVMRNYSAVTAACMITRKSIFQKVGRFDEKNLAVAYNDVDYCLKLISEGYRVVYNPEALLFHHEGASRGFSDMDHELIYFKNKWSELINNDPYYNINLSLENEQFNIRTK